MNQPISSEQFLNDSGIILSSTIPYLARTLKFIRDSSSLPDLLLISDYINSSKMESLVFSNLLLYACVSVTSIITAFVASKTLMMYQKPLRKIFGMLKTYVEDCILFWFTAAWLVAVCFPYGCCVSFRYFTGLYMRLRYGKLGDVSTGLDAAGSYDVPEARQIIKVLEVLKGKCDINEFREKVKATACKTDPKTGDWVYPKFHQYLHVVGKYYCWKPSIFDMNHHVRFVDGLDENSESVDEGKMMEIVSKYSNAPFEKDRGLWEILIIPKIHYKWEEECEKKEEKFAIFVRLSHGIGDGFSFLKMIMRDMADETEAYVPPSKPVENSWPMKIFIFFYLFLKAPRAFYVQMKLKDKNPMHNETIKMTGEKVHIWSDPVDIEWLKGLKNKLGCGMNVLLLNTLSSACRKYMKIECGLNDSQLPDKIYSIIPVPAPNHPDNTLVNKFTIFMMPLDIKRESPLERCREIAKQNKLKGQSPDAYVNLFLMDLVAVFPLSLAKWFVVNQQCTCVVSNLPGPRKAIKIWGYPLEDSMFWLPNVGTSGVSVSYLSYGNKMRFGLAVDTGVIPTGKKGAEQLLSWMLEDLQNLAAAVNYSPDQGSMFVKVEKPSTSTTNLDNALNIKLDKDEVASEDYGYGGEPSDISSTDDTDEDMEELTMKLSQEIVGFKNSKAREDDDDPVVCSSDEPSVVEQKSFDGSFQSISSVTKRQCGVNCDANSNSIETTYRSRSSFSDSTSR